MRAQIFQLFAGALTIAPRVLVLGLSLTVPSTTYTVVPGDTLFDIAWRFNVTLICLETSNPQIRNPDLIFPGDVLNIPSSETAVPYTVISGDYLSLIAAKFNVTLEAIEEANPQILDPDFITPGEIIKIPNICASSRNSSALQPCGDAYYDPQNYTCYGSNFLCPISEGEPTLLCGNDCYLPEKYTCYHGTTLCPVLGGQPTLLCGKDCYLPWQYCCVDSQIVQIAACQAATSASLSSSAVRSSGNNTIGSPTTMTTSSRIMTQSTFSETEIIIGSTTIEIGSGTSTITVGTETLVVGPSGVGIGSNTIQFPSTGGIITSDGITFTIIESFTVIESGPPTLTTPPNPPETMTTPSSILTQSTLSETETEIIIGSTTIGVGSGTSTIIVGTETLVVGPSGIGIGSNTIQFPSGTTGGIITSDGITFTISEPGPPTLTAPPNPPESSSFVVVTGADGEITLGVQSSTETGRFSTITTSIDITTYSQTTTQVGGHKTILPIWPCLFPPIPLCAIIIVPLIPLLPGGHIPPPSCQPEIVFGNNGLPTPVFAGASLCVPTFTTTQTTSLPTNAGSLAVPAFVYDTGFTVDLNSTTPVTCGTPKNCESNGCNGTFADGTAICQEGDFAGCSCLPSINTPGFSCGTPRNCETNGCNGTFANGKATCQGDFQGCTCLPSINTPGFSCGPPQPCERNNCNGTIDSNGAATCQNDFAGCACTADASTPGFCDDAPTLCDTGNCGGTLNTVTGIATCQNNFPGCRCTPDAETPGFCVDGISCNDPNCLGSFPPNLPTGQCQTPSQKGCTCQAPAPPPTQNSAFFIGELIEGVNPNLTPHIVAWPSSFGCGSVTITPLAFELTAADPSGDSIPPDSLNSLLTNNDVSVTFTGIDQKFCGQTQSITFSNTNGILDGSVGNIDITCEFQDPGSTGCTDSQGNSWALGSLWACDVVGATNWCFGDP